MAQLVEHDLAKVGVAGSSPVSRSIVKIRDSIYAISYFYSSPILDSKFEVYAAAPVGANQAPLEPGTVSRSMKNKLRNIMVSV